MRRRLAAAHPRKNTGAGAAGEIAARARPDFLNARQGARR